MEVEKTGEQWRVVERKNTTGKVQVTVDGDGKIHFS